MYTNLQNIYYCVTRYLEANMKFISYACSKGIENFENPSECLRKEYNFGCVLSVLKVYATQPLEFGECATRVDRKVRDSRRGFCDATAVLLQFLRIT